MTTPTPPAATPVPKVALVTGCGKPDGVGQGVARALAAAGAAVVVTDKELTGVRNRRQELLGVAGPEHWHGLKTLAEEIAAAGGTASYAVGDVGDEAGAQALVDHAVAQHGRLDILVNNAAAPQGLDRADIEAVTPDLWDLQIRVNLRGTYLMSRAAVAVMRANRWGRIVNVSSMAGMVGAPRSTAYSASKAGVIGFTRALAMDVAPWGITVNAICPGMVGTSRSILSDDPSLDQDTEIARRGRNIPVGRAGMPEDIAAAAVFLASASSSYMTGQTLVMDGGGITPFPLTRPADDQAGT